MYQILGDYNYFKEKKYIEDVGGGFAYRKRKTGEVKVFDRHV